MGFPTPRDTPSAPVYPPAPGTTEESPVQEQAAAVKTSTVPAGAEQLARRGVAWLNHLQAFANAAQNDLESFLPETAVTSVESEVATIVKGLFS